MPETCTRCRATGELTTYHHPYNNPSYTIGYLCSTCAGSETMIVDYDNNVMPMYFANIGTVYDGDNDRQMQNPRDVFINFYDYFSCSHCTHDFYGHGVHMEDTDDWFCAHCANEYAYYSAEDNLWYTSEDEAPDARRDIYFGSQNLHFRADHPVGIEFEHAPCRAIGTDRMNIHSYIMQGGHDRMQYSHAFDVHGDGSIAQLNGYHASEIVSKPATGHLLHAIIDRFYEPYAEGLYAPGPEHHTCGFHVHVQSDALNHFRTTGDTGATARRFKYALAIIDNVCKQFISPSRRKNSYCNGGVHLREKNMHYSGADTLRRIFGSTSYPSTAIRTIGTVEFRMWPSTNSKNYMLARVELSQKIIEFADRYAIGEMTDADRNVMKEQLDELTSTMKDNSTFLVQRLMDMMNISMDCSRALTTIHRRFNPFKYHLSYFRFTDKQIAFASEDDPIHNREVSIPESMAESGRLHIMDTCVSNGMNDSTCLTLSNAPRCYPADAAGASIPLIKQLAKGEI